MAFCPNCGAQYPDGSASCPNCGYIFTPVNPAPQQPQGQPEQPQPQMPYQPMPPYQQPYYQPMPVVDQYDHTAEYDAKDISDNKIFAMLPYLTGVIGMIICLLAAQKSEYAMFHVREAAKIYVVELLLALCLCVPFIGWIFSGIMIPVMAIVEIIMFISVCKGKAKEAPIVKKLKFLK